MFAYTLTLLLVVGAVIGGAIPDEHPSSTSVTNSTSAPSNTTSVHTTTTAKPTNATSAPSNTTSAPTTTTAKPTNATSAPSNTTSVPTSTTAKPTNATSAPSNTTLAPSSTTIKPNTTTVKQNVTTTTTTTEDPGKTGPFQHLEGVDPNTLSCDPKGEVFLLLPSFTDCSKFYMCAHGEEVEFNCAPGTVFDFVIQTCNHPWATECILRTPKEDSETEGSGFGHEPEAYGMFGEEIENGPMDFLRADSAGTVRPVAGNAGKLYKGPLNCQRADSASRQVAYNGDCQRYWHCVGPAAKVSYCSDGLLFNELTQQCDFEANVRCLVQDDEELKGEFIMYK